MSEKKKALKQLELSAFNNHDFAFKVMTAEFRTGRKTDAISRRKGRIEVFSINSPNLQL